MAHDAERLARFNREAKALAALNHPNIAATPRGLLFLYSTRLLLLHGLTETWRVWRPCIEDLGSTQALIIPDLRGHGDTPNPASTLTPMQVAQDMIGLLDSLDVTQVRVIGYSFGGHVALRLAALQPERVEAMVVIAGAHRLLGASRQWHEDALESPVPRDWRLDEAATWHPGGENQVAEVLSQGLRGVLAPEFDMSDSELSAIRARALIIQGDNEDFFPLDVPLDLYEHVSEELKRRVPVE